MALSALCCGVSLAVPAKRGTYTHMQRDGSSVTVRMVGDEFYHQWVSTTDGRVMDRGANGSYGDKGGMSAVDIASIVNILAGLN
ncbi:MAG: hypothetical protein II609_01380 [Muribaculaceae bacterium]|nr:hypothetical protein [Muribaculaceae bacterium]